MHSLLLIDASDIFDFNILIILEELTRQPSVASKLLSFKLINSRLLYRSLH